MQNFPRVLFITPIAFNPFKGGGATYASLFSGWPKECLATIHNDTDPTRNDICDKYFTLGSEELNLIEPFGSFHRYRRSSNQSSQNLQSTWIDSARKLLVGDSIPERSHLTPELHRWIADYRPDLIYTILGTNGMMALIEDIRTSFNLPLVLHIMDDWATTAHKSGIFGPLERFRMKRWLKHFFSVAHSCLGISAAMREAYSKRYGRQFTPIQYALDVERWAKRSKKELAAARPPEFLYIGSIFPEAQLQSLRDCALAVSQLNEEGYHSTLRIVTSARSIARYRHLLELHPNIKLSTSAFDETEFLETLVHADVLLLPSNFDSHSVSLIRYSMPTKIPSYLVSGTPVFVYGSPKTAQVQYALDSGWAHTLTHRSITQLKLELRRIVDDLPLRQRLSAAARLASKNHDANVVRPAFQDVLRQAAEAHKTPL